MHGIFLSFPSKSFLHAQTLLLFQTRAAMRTLTVYVLSFESYRHNLKPINSKRHILQRQSLIQWKVGLGSIKDRLLNTLGAKRRSSRILINSANYARSQERTALIYTNC